ncbi:hypothetical protein L598_008500000050 [Mesorhizobium sp. J18]|uniref:hypothetical protein n=1 Tax=Mesorhizobium sp. J18 TaxID=935263 RepID=UPI00119A62A1|nr:hypothetical protein [Mesorhizobium sp. J18]TWG89378.1 hypothetical protein L598_008500000050 [Mesorhizobium sp. J18]
MLRQYSPQRHRYERVGGYERAVGTIPVGTIFLLDIDTATSRAVPYIVEAWLPRRIGAGRRVGSQYHDTYAARGGHLAQVRNLATGMSRCLSDHLILRAVDDA